MLWGLRNREYLTAMAAVTPLVDEDAYHSLNVLFNRPRGETWRERLQKFVEYLVAEDSKWCRVPGHKAYIGQHSLTEMLQKTVGLR